MIVGRRQSSRENIACDICDRLYETSLVVLWLFETSLMKVAKQATATRSGRPFVLVEDQSLRT